MIGLIIHSSSQPADYDCSNNLVNSPLLTSGYRNGAEKPITRTYTKKYNNVTVNCRIPYYVVDFKVRCMFLDKLLMFLAFWPLNLFKEHSCMLHVVRIWQLRGYCTHGSYFWRLCVFSQKIKQFRTKYPMDLIRKPRDSKITVLFQ